MRILGIIPSRYASSRFPGKPLVEIQGKSMIRRVYEQARKTSSIERVIVATDDQRIFDHVQAFGGEVLMTNSDHRSGTDRCAEVAARLPEYEVVINIQGDEPFIQPRQIDLAVAPLLKTPEAQIATLAKQIMDIEMVHNPNVVKVVCNLNGRALYFSRNPIPYVRDRRAEEWLEAGRFFKHIGLYAFKSSILQQVAQLAPSELEKMEGLEQLRWLENGYSIEVSFTSEETLGIDRPEDLDKVR
jgi:3-deoxy-manno-octulosonate cytidylyltransferase (CMP-KDO synthetase)